MSTKTTVEKKKTVQKESQVGCNCVSVAHLHAAILTLNSSTLEGIADKNKIPVPLLLKYPSSKIFVNG